MNLASLFEPKPLSYYESMTTGGTHEVTLSQQEEAVLLKCYDHGVGALASDELLYLNTAIGKLKQEIWP